MDIIMLAAFVAFFAMVLSWLAAPAAAKRSAAPGSDPSRLTIGEARA
jgi:hypothetical protein